MSDPRSEYQPVRWVPIEGCAIPVPVDVEWTLRYGTTEAREAARMSAASVVNAYAHLLNPNVLAADAIAALRRARRAAAHIGRSTPNITASCDVESGGSDE